jgi:hypothetical protein
MSITPNSTVFTALSLADIARPQPRTQAPRPPAGKAAGVDQAADATPAPARQQVTEDVRREAVTPQRSTYQRLGQLVDLSV